MAAELDREAVLARELHRLGLKWQQSGATEISVSLVHASVGNRAISCMARDGEQIRIGQQSGQGCRSDRIGQ